MFLCAFLYWTVIYKLVTVWYKVKIKLSLYKAANQWGNGGVAPIILTSDAYLSLPRLLGCPARNLMKEWNVEGKYCGLQRYKDLTAGLQKIHLGYFAVSIGKSLATFRSTLLPPSSELSSSTLTSQKVCIFGRHLIRSIIPGFPWRAEKGDQRRRSGLPVSGLRSKPGTTESKARVLVTRPWRPICSFGRLEKLTCTEPYPRPCTFCQPDHFSQNHFWMEQIWVVK
jgi:hypothetical protein